MSTKSSLAHGDEFHLYHDLMDGYDDVNLEIRGDKISYEASPHSVVVHIPIHVWEHIRHRGGFVPRYAAMDDEALLAHVTKEVDERIREWEESGRSGLVAFFGSLVYGSADEPRVDQIRHGVEYLTHRRGVEREIAARIEALQGMHAASYGEPDPQAEPKPSLGQVAYEAAEAFMEARVIRTQRRETWSELEPETRQYWDTVVEAVNAARDARR